MFDQKEFLKKLKQAVLQHDAGASVILFGSRARGDFRADSDWDVLVLTDETTDTSYQNKIRDAVNDVELEYLQPISIIIRNRQDWEDWAVIPLYKSVAKEGIAI